MDGSVLHQLDRLRPRIKQRWDTLLRAQPVASPLASPDTLVYLMDETLSQLCAAGRGRSVKSWLRHHPALLAPLRSQCACGINPLLAYYSTGLIALREVAGPVLGAAAEDAAVFFQGIAHKDIEALCGLCRHKSEDHCEQAQIAHEHPALSGR